MEKQSNYKIIKLYDVSITIMNKAVVVPELNLKVYDDGTTTLEIDEYNHIINSIYRDWMKKKNLK